MRKSFLLPFFIGLLAVLVCFADDIRTIERNVPISDGRFIMLDDHSFWIIYAPNKKKRNVIEWITRSSIPQPEDNFLFPLEHWRSGTMINIQSHLWSEQNQEDLKKYHQPNIAMCTHLFENYLNQQMAYARKVSPKEAIDLFSEYAQECFDKGKKRGKKEGWGMGYYFGKSQQ